MSTGWRGMPAAPGDVPFVLNTDQTRVPFVPRPRLLQAVGTVKRQLCSVYRQLFLSSASQSLSQGLRDRAQKLMR